MSSCSYHADKQGSWHCPSCIKSFCTTCFPGGEKNFDGTSARCPLCRSELTFSVEDEDLPPFWRISWQFFRYPLQLQPMILLGLLFLVTQIAMSDLSATVTEQAGQLVVGGVLALALFIMVIHYGLAIIAALSEEQWQAPKLFDSESNILLTFKLLVALFVMYFFAGLLSMVSHSLAVIASVLVTLSIPAVTMVIALTHSLRDATNPAILARVMVRIGWSYLLLWFAYTAVSNGGTALVWLFEGTESIKFLVTLLVVGSAYFSLVAYAMMGYTLFVNRNKLGLGNAEQQGVSLEPAEYDCQRVLGYSHLLLFEGRKKQAFEMVKDGLRRYPNEMRLRERMHRLLMLSEQTVLLDNHSQRYLALLHEKGNIGAAARTLDEVITKIPGFEPEPELRYAIANIYFQQGRFDKAEALIGEPESWPASYTDRAGLYLLLAKAGLESGRPLQSVAEFAATAGKLATPASQQQLEAQQLNQMALKMAEHSE
ncbi:tetratricopeptide repeat protein [Corallincola spongiicola]|uniref:Tetratricopeptide repeat protein n=1 Tax=Corallincola spongiicola TaxID=2520508 RepID=A0ABY1WTW0_9GAMM|nr:tetratricopeptide repeat protein [Corallincola spongiicola]TAA48170.1 tetratricopeptide repeat protein [Corallincola spongiicola]